ATVHFLARPSQFRASSWSENISAATQRFLATSTANPSTDGGFPTHAILGCISLDRKYVTVSVPSRYFSKVVSLPSTARASTRIRFTCFSSAVSYVCFRTSQAALNDSSPLTTTSNSAPCTSILCSFIQPKVLESMFVLV